MSPLTRNWYDKILDAIVGEPEGPSQKYALICSRCATHNGLALPEEFLTIRE